MRVRRHNPQQVDIEDLNGGELEGIPEVEVARKAFTAGITSEAFSQGGADVATMLSMVLRNHIPQFNVPEGRLGEQVLMQLREQFIIHVAGLIAAEAMTEAFHREERGSGTGMAGLMSRCTALAQNTGLAAAYMLEGDPDEDAAPTVQ